MRIRDSSVSRGFLVSQARFAKALRGAPAWRPDRSAAASFPPRERAARCLGAREHDNESLARRRADSDPREGVSLPPGT
jgi:hypothetical protein